MRLRIADFAHDALDIHPDAAVQQVGLAALSLRPFHRRDDVFEDMADMTINLATFDSRLHGAATRVAEHHHEPGAQMLDGVFDAAKHVFIDDVAGDPDHEQRAKALIEDDVWGNSGIGAGEDNGKGFLPSSQGASAAGTLIGVLHHAGE